ncbi:MAG TPA: GGDEF domain-containing protein [Tepidisphaeraceae bacterium]|nr:GGDEF domain-containing protein [Tepidisphaeraceae bacterium]
MTSAPDPQHSGENPSSAHRPARWARGWVIAGVCVGVFGATEYLVATLVRQSPYTLTVPLSLIVMVGVAVVLSAVGAAVRIYHHWVTPAARVERALRGVRSGEVPIDELVEGGLARTCGGLAGLVAPVEELLRELREARAEVARLNAEMHQRVAQRTDALERRLGSMRARADRDPLTGLLNRRALEEMADDVVGKCVAGRQPVCAAMIDLDDFKLLNDTLGHAAGDEFLKSVGQLIRSSVRQHDLAIRCGGDEFALLLPDTGRAEADQMIKRLVELVDGLAKTLPLSRKPRLSAGLASGADWVGAPTAKELFEVADRSLYVTKHARKSGRGERRAG